MKELKVKITFTEELLGTANSNPDIHEEFIASNAPDAPSRKEEVEALGVEEVVEKAKTIFPRDEDGCPIMWDYQIKGFFKDTCSALKKVSGTQSSKIKAFKKEIDKLKHMAPQSPDYQVQYNYLDEHSQAGRRGVEYAYSKGIPVIIMEPLRGGKLVDLLPDKAKKIISEFPVRRSAAEWGLRWLWDQKEVTVVLSGMGSDAMLQENIAIASESRVGQIPEKERELYANVVRAINETVKVGCTGCGYCQPCPKGVDIPGAFAAYNRWYGEDKSNAFMDYLKCTTLRKNSTGAGNCIGCGKCEKHCPQNIPIRQELQEVQRVLETPVYRVIKKAAGWFVHF